MIEKYIKVNKNAKAKLTKTQTSRVLTLSELKTLCIEPSSLSLNIRHDKIREVVLLMGFLGLRVSEAINFPWQTINVNDKIGLIVKGKRNKQRLVFNLFNHPYIEKKIKLHREKEEKDRWKKVSRVAVWKYLKKKKINFSWDITPHTLRRSFASILHFEHGLSASAIQNLLGHTQFRTTERYLKKDDRFLVSQLQKSGFLSRK